MNKHPGGAAGESTEPEGDPRSLPLHPGRLFLTTHSPSKGHRGEQTRAARWEGLGGWVEKGDEIKKYKLVVTGQS